MDKLPQRKNIRLQNYDYSKSGYYFITICTKNIRNILWEVEATRGRQFNILPLSNIGQIINTEIINISSIYGSVKIDKIWNYIDTNPLRWENDEYYI